MNPHSQSPDRRSDESDPEAAEKYQRREQGRQQSQSDQDGEPEAVEQASEQQRAGPADGHGNGVEDRDVLAGGDTG